MHENKSLAFPENNMNPMNPINPLQTKINEVFEGHFSRTPLRQRLEDIQKETMELCRYIDLRNLKEETGDLLASAIQLCNENEWDFETLVQNTLDKINRRQLQYKTLGRKTYVAILGGSFNPPTLGHIKLAQFVLNASRAFDEIWLVPCFSHIFNKDLVSAEHRLSMCNLATQIDGRIKVFDYEIKHQLHGETYHFLKRLMEEDFAKDKYDFSYIIGLDNANTFDKWVNYQDLERMMRFIVVSRKGIERDEKVDWYLKAPHIFLSPDHDEIPEISSTEIRSGFRRYGHIQNMGIKTDKDDVAIEISDRLKHYIGEDVFDYIVTNGLYKENK